MTDDPMDLVAILRADGLNCTCNAWYSGECCCEAVWADGYIGEAADEIERLRSLIAAWADAYDNGPNESDMSDAYFALRKEVGR